MALTYNEIDTCIRHVLLPKLVDNVFHHTYLLERMWRKHQVQTGGQGFEQGLEYEKNPNIGTYTAYGEFRRVPKETITKARVDWKHYYAGIPFSHIQSLMNTGNDGKLIDLAASKMKGGQKSLRDRLCADLYCDGSAYQWPTGSGHVVEPMEGLKLICGEDRTYGGIDSTTETWWDAQYEAISGTPTWTNIVTSSDAAYLPLKMREMIHACNDGSDEVTLIIMGDVLWDALTFIAETKERFSKMRVGRGRVVEKDNGETANMGFTALIFDGVPVVCDKTYCPAGEIFFLNEDHLFMKTLAGASMDYVPRAQIPGSDAELATILLSTNLLCDNCARQGRQTGWPVARA